MLPCSPEITILRKQNRKGSDVSCNRITRKQKPPRLALFQKLELGTFEPFPVFFGFRGKSFSRHTWTNHTSILLYWILFSDNIGCCCRYKRMSEKTGRWNCGWIPVRHGRNWGQSKGKCTAAKTAFDPHIPSFWQKNIANSQQKVDIWVFSCSESVDSSIDGIVTHSLTHWLSEPLLILEHMTWHWMSKSYQRKLS